MSDIVERLRTPIDADKIYDWVIQKRKETRSDLPRLGFCNDMGLIDDEREEAVAEITRLRAELAEARKALQLIQSAAEQSSEWPPRRRGASLDGIEKVAIRALKSPKTADPLTRWRDVVKQRTANRSCRSALRSIELARAALGQGGSQSRRPNH